MQCISPNRWCETTLLFYFFFSCPSELLTYTEEIIICQNLENVSDHFDLCWHISAPRAVTKFCFLAQQWILWTTEAIWANELKKWSQISIFSIPHFCLSTTFYCSVACDCVLPAVIFFTTFLNQNHENTTGSSRFPPHWLLLQNMLLLAGNKFHTKLPIAKNLTDYPKIKNSEL